MSTRGYLQVLLSTHLLCGLRIYHTQQVTSLGWGLGRGLEVEDLSLKLWKTTKRASSTGTNLTKTKSGLGFRIFSETLFNIFHFHMRLVVSQVPSSLPVLCWHDAGIAWGATPNWYVFPYQYTYPYYIPRLLAPSILKSTLKTRKFPKLFVTKITASQHQHISVEKLIHFDIFILKNCSLWKIGFPWQIFCSLKFILLTFSTFMKIIQLAVG